MNFQRSRAATTDIFNSQATAYLLYETIGALWLRLVALIITGFTAWVSFFYRDKSETIAPTKWGNDGQ